MCQDTREYNLTRYPINWKELDLNVSRQAPNWNVEPWRQLLNGISGAWWADSVQDAGSPYQDEDMRKDNLENRQPKEVGNCWGWVGNSWDNWQCSLHETFVSITVCSHWHYQRFHLRKAACKMGTVSRVPYDCEVLAVWTFRRRILNLVETRHSQKVVLSIVLPFFRSTGLLQINFSKGIHFKSIRLSWYSCRVSTHYWNQ